jgi:L-malate glycosyltransferase
MRYKTENKLTDIGHWENVQGSIQLEVLESDPIKNWLDTNFVVNRISNCLEVGCYPGRYLAYFGEKGFEINGIDYLPETKFLFEASINKDYKVGKIICDDFFEYKFERKYDVVCSFGFVEHFKNWEDVFKLHMDLVDNNGYLVIECPNYKGIFQVILRYFFDRKNLLRHNRHSMNLSKWEKLLLQNNFQIVYANYFGGYKLWFIKEPRNKAILLLRSILIRLFSSAVQMTGLKNHKIFSSYMGVIAIKNSPMESY